VYEREGFLVVPEEHKTVETSDPKERNPDVEQFSAANCEDAEEHHAHKGLDHKEV
jgi:hypothetical protein